MQRIHRNSFTVPHEPYRLRKRFRHEEERILEPVKWHKNIYDQDQGYILGSSPFRWFTRLIFFTCLYSGICAFWFMCHAVYLTTQPEDQPKYFIHTAPGMSLAPHIQHLTVPFIRYRDKMEVDIDDYTHDIDQFLNKYGIMNEDYGNCTAENEYGYMELKPCVFIKINRIIGFIPNTYNSAEELPADAPSDLKVLLHTLPPSNRTNRVWITCKPQRNLETKIEYWPKLQSVPADLLNVPEKIEYSEGEFYNSEEYERIIAVQLSGFHLDERFNVDCYTWAKNIEQTDDGHGFRGYLRFIVNVRRPLFNPDIE